MIFDVLLEDLLRGGGVASLLVGWVESLLFRLHAPVPRFQDGDGHLSENDLRPLVQHDRQRDGRSVARRQPRVQDCDDRCRDKSQSVFRESYA